MCEAQSRCQYLLQSLSDFWIESRSLAEPKACCFGLVWLLGLLWLASLLQESLFLPPMNWNYCRLPCPLGFLLFTFHSFIHLTEALYVVLATLELTR